MEPFAGRVSIVTGAGSGIGREIAAALARAGSRVVLTDLSRDAAHTEADRLTAEGCSVIPRRCDVTLEADVRECVECALTEFGQLDISVHSAGVQFVAPIEDFPTDVFDRMLRIMVTGPFLGMKHAIPAMRARGYGRILSLASVNGLVGFAGKAAYNSAKHGVIGLTKVAALELARAGITVNALCPGYVDTPLVRGQLADLARTRGLSEDQVLEEVILSLVPQHRLLSTQEVADYALFLLSDRAAGVTGQAVVLDGGYTAQ
ncbi:MAG: 3-hydroxybutyrate dehydrogenase [Isosphaeraceae bacterium]|nr:3-hydroxybutyrate dehydrogenase [Isosphaeraceae bacterium]